MVDREVIKSVRFSPDEMRMIQEKMRQFGTTNFSAFVRKMTIDGYVVKLELPELKEMCNNSVARCFHLCYSDYNVTRRTTYVGSGIQ